MSTEVIEIRGMFEALRDVESLPRRMQLAQQRAIGTLRRRLGTEAKRDIGAEYNLRAQRIAEGLSVRDVPDGLRVVGKARGINAIEFEARWSRVTGSGLTATLSRRKFVGIRYHGKLRGDAALGARFAIKRGKPASVHAGSFIASGKNGATLVFERTQKAIQTHKRLPIQGVYGPSVGQMLKHGRRPQRLVDFAIRTLQAEQRRLLGA